MYSYIHLLKHALTQFPNLLKKNWILGLCVKNREAYPWLGQNVHHWFLRSWNHEGTNHGFNCASKASNQHVKPPCNKQGKYALWTYIK